MPALFICDKCGTKAWNRAPSEGGKMISENVLKRGTICPNCGYDLKTGAIGDAGMPSEKQHPWWKFWQS